MSENTEVREEVKASSRLWLGGADCMITTLNNIMTGGGLTFFFVTYLGMDVTYSATCWLLFGLWNAFNDPLFGYISDRTNTKLGRRRPYIRYGSIAVAMIFILSWQTWTKNSSNMAMFIQMFASLFLFDMLYTAIATSLYVMPFEMAVTNKVRGRIMVTKAIFGLVALSVPLVLLGMIESILAGSLANFQMLMTAIGLVAGAVIFTSTFFYKENDYAKQEEQYPFFKSLATCFTNKSFLVFESISFSITYIQTALMMGLSYYFTAFGINMMFCYIAMFVGILAGMYIWMKPGARWGLKKSVVYMCLAFGGGLLVMMLLGRYQIAGIIGFLGSGLGFAGGMYVIPLMNGDVIDYDEHVSGLRREGMYAGVNSFICKPAISIANALFPAMLLWFGYDSRLNIASQSAAAKNGILVSWLLVSVVLLFVCALIIWKFYPLDGEQWTKTKQELAARHEAKQAAYEAEVLAKRDSK